MKRREPLVEAVQTTANDRWWPVVERRSIDGGPARSKRACLGLLGQAAQAGLMVKAGSAHGHNEKDFFSIFQMFL
jgi:hypothetical protein